MVKLMLIVMLLIVKSDTAAWEIVTHIYSIQVSRQQAAETTSVEINTMVSQFRKFKEMENKLCFDFSSNPS